MRLSLEGELENILMALGSSGEDERKKYIGKVLLLAISWFSAKIILLPIENCKEHQSTPFPLISFLTNARSLPSAQVPGEIVRRGIEFRDEQSNRVSKMVFSYNSFTPTVWEAAESKLAQRRTLALFFQTPPL